MSDIYGAKPLYTFTGPDGRGVAYRHDSVIGCMIAGANALGLPASSNPLDDWIQVQCRDFIWKGREASGATAGNKDHDH
jgi:hypothetical protein